MLLDRESVACEPACNGRDVRLGGTKLLADLSGREPLVVVGRTGVVLTTDKCLERGLLLRTPAQDEREIGQNEAGADGAAIVFGVRVRAGVAFERYKLTFVNRGQDADGGCGLLGQRCRGAENDTGQNAQWERA